MFQAYIDDSASHHRSIFVLAGYIAPAERWAALAEEWQALLDEEPPLTRFKMYDMAQSNVRRDRCEGFYRAIERHVSGAISCTLKANELEAVVDSMPWPDFVKNVEVLKNPYYEAVRAIVQKLAQYQHKFGISEPIDFVFDDQTEKTRVLDAWNYMYLSVSPDIRRLLGDPPIFRIEDTTLPLQAADFWAWWVRRWEEDKNTDGLKNLDFASAKVSWKAKRDMPRIAMLFGEDDFRQNFEKTLASEDALRIARTPDVAAAVAALRRAESS